MVWLPLKHPLLGACTTTQACALTGNQTSDPLVCRPALNPLSYTSQGGSVFNGHGIIGDRLTDVWHRFDKIIISKEKLSSLEQLLFVELLL